MTIIGRFVTGSDICSVIYGSRVYLFLLAILWVSSLPNLFSYVVHSSMLSQ